MDGPKEQTVWDRFLEETQDSEKEHIRYLSKDIAFLKELKEEHQTDWEFEETLSFLIHEESQLMDACKRRWLNAEKGKRKAEPQGISGRGPDNQQPRNADAIGKGNEWMDKSQIPDAEPGQLLPGIQGR